MHNYENMYMYTQEKHESTCTHAFKDSNVHILYTLYT